MQWLQEMISRVEEPSDEDIAKARERLNNLTKPKGSLGRLEDIAAKMAAIKRSIKPSIRRKAIFVFAGDHGVTAEGVSAYPREVTHQMVLNFLRGGAAINVLARHAGADVVVVDVGVDHDFGALEGLISKKIMRGTRNMRRGPAMTKREALESLRVGADLARDYAESGYDIIGLGDMGIGNTTPSSAITAVVCGLRPEEVTGRGTGIDDAGLGRKIEVIKDAMKINAPDASDPLDVLAKVGGLEIGAIAGAVIGAASRRAAVIIDGFISTAGAAIALLMCPGAARYVFASHASVEIGHRALLRRFGLDPVLDLNMRLGEGTGAALAMGIIEAGCKIMSEMATFDEAGVSKEDEAEG